ncbi:MAG: hypothetical protein EGR80_07580 [Ruminiclostridium sp.]|nr:hypothetical protein [Ruminiclostridium sp.]
MGRYFINIAYAHNEKSRHVTIARILRYESVQIAVCIKGSNTLIQHITMKSDKTLNIQCLDGKRFHLPLAKTLSKEIEYDNI